MGAHYSSHLFEQYKGNLSFGFHIVLCIRAHVVQLVCLQDQVHNLFIPCPHGRFDLTFERCTFCSFIITSSHSKLHSSCRRGLGYKCGLTAQTLVDPTKGPQIEEGEGPGISGTQTLVSQSRSHRIRGQQDRVDTSVLQRVTYASLQRFPPPGLKLLHSTGLPQSTFITAVPHRRAASSACFPPSPPPPHLGPSPISAAEGWMGVDCSLYCGEVT